MLYFRGEKMKDTIRFWGDQGATEVLRLSAEGIWANPDIPADDAAKLVLAAIEYNIKVLVQKAVEVEREALIDIVAMHGGSVEIEAAIRARGKE
jgi:hypothetical protein